jgi:uncharacterized NAD(P)/FAD-binding protein YdhS
MRRVSNVVEQRNGCTWYYITRSMGGQRYAITVVLSAEEMRNRDCVAYRLKGARAYLATAHKAQMLQDLYGDG